MEVGREVSAADLITVQVAGGQGLHPVPAGRLNEVVGKRAAVALVPGTLLTLGQVTDDPLLGPGQQQIALGLKTAQVPARQLHPGDKVLLVSTPDENATGAAAGAGTRFAATVIDMVSPTDDEKVLYLALLVRDVPAVVALAAQERIAVVLTEAA